MATLAPLWWTTPIQALAALSSGFNGGASSLQSLMIFPMLSTPDVPPMHTGLLMRDLLHRSDSFFPRINAFGTLTNLALALVAFFKRHTNAAAAAKWQVLAAAAALNIGVTVWSLRVQVPINNKIREASKRVAEGEGEGGVNVREVREAMAQWRPRALVRGTMMMMASALGMYAVFLDGKYL